MQYSRRDFIQLTFAGLGACLLGACSPGTEPTGTEPTGATDLTAYFLKVGKADAIILTTGTTTVMVDTGDANSADDTVNRLDELGITTIDTLIITHFDQDHVGGAAAVLDTFNVGEVLTTYQSKESDEIDAYEESLAACGLTPRIVSTDETFKRGDMAFEVFAPKKTAYKKDMSNNSSLVCRVTFGETRLLLAGDIQAERIDELVSSGHDLSCDLLKVPHHGAYEEEATDKLVAATSPRFAVICCSKKKPEDYETDYILAAADADCFLTREGEVLATSNGTTLDVTQ